MDGDGGTAGSTDPAPANAPAAGRGYHHGNLREALIEAGTAILDSQGLPALSLRACAKHAGVSHAAPQHHFGNLEGLRTALAALAFRRFTDAMAAEQAAAGPAPEDRLRAAGRGYVRFATAHPGLFRLMFSKAQVDHDDPALQQASRAAYALLGDTVRPFLRDPGDEAEDHRLRLLVWSTVHGYAHLLLEGQFKNRGVSADGLSHLPDLAAVVRGLAPG